MTAPLPVGAQAPIICCRTCGKAHAGTLSKREHEVLALVLKGKAIAEIAIALGIASGTVKFHITHILQKRGVNSTRKLIAQNYSS